MSKLECRWCGGPKTSEYVKVQLWYACIRCDTGAGDMVKGPPRFAALWAERAKQLGTNEKGSD